MSAPPASHPEVIPFGFVGCGGFTTGNHLPNVARIPASRIRSLCDLDAEVLSLHDCLCRGLPIPTDEVRGAEAVILALKAIESLETGQVARLDWANLLPPRPAPRRRG